MLHSFTGRNPVSPGTSQAAHYTPKPPVYPQKRFQFNPSNADLALQTKRFIGVEK
jgi:hypothetical protein